MINLYRQRSIHLHTTLVTCHRSYSNCTRDFFTALVGNWSRLQHDIDCENVAANRVLNVTAELEHLTCTSGTRLGLSYVDGIPQQHSKGVLTWYKWKEHNRIATKCMDYKREYRSLQASHQGIEKRHWSALAETKKILELERSRRK